MALQYPTCFLPKLYLETADHGAWHWEHCPAAIDKFLYRFEKEPWSLESYLRLLPCELHSVIGRVFPQPNDPVEAQQWNALISFEHKRWWNRRRQNDQQMTYDMMIGQPGRSRDTLLTPARDANGRALLPEVYHNHNMWGQGWAMDARAPRLLELRYDKADGSLREFLILIKDELWTWANRRWPGRNDVEFPEEGNNQEIDTCKNVLTFEVKRYEVEKMRREAGISLHEAIRMMEQGEGTGNG